MSELRPQILLVEDDENIRETLRELLDEEGFEVCVACHGRRAMDLLTCGCRPQVILLDLMMPVMDGWQMLSLLRGHKELSHIPVIVVSAARDGVPEGATDYLKKPVDLESLLAVVETFCSSPLEMPCSKPSQRGGMTTH